MTLLFTINHTLTTPTYANCTVCFSPNLLLQFYPLYCNVVGIIFPIYKSFDISVKKLKSELTFYSSVRVKPMNIENFLHHC